jgi:hypothetical protein
MVLIIAILTFLFGVFVGRSTIQQANKSLVVPKPNEDTLEGYLLENYPNAS